jgi:hypothetical protein
MAKLLHCIKVMLFDRVPRKIKRPAIMMPDIIIPPSDDESLSDTLIISDNDNDDYYGDDDSISMTDDSLSSQVY